MRSKGNFCTGTAEVRRIPDGVKKIEADAVGDLDTLEEIHIPVSVKTIESEAFDGSNNIKRVYYDGSQNQWNQIEIGSSNDGFLKGTIYYGNEEDCTTTGWKSINGVWYYFDASGSMHRLGIYRKCLVLF